jgi:hypothetical protein
MRTDLLLLSHYLGTIDWLSAPVYFSNSVFPVHCSMYVQLAPTLPSNRDMIDHLDLRDLDLCDAVPCLFRLLQSKRVVPVEMLQV